MNVLRFDVLALVATGCAIFLASTEAQGRQLCRFPDGQQRIVQQALGAGFGMSVTDCRPLPALPAEAPESPAAYRLATRSLSSEVDINVSVVTLEAPGFRARPAAPWLASPRRPTTAPAEYAPLIARSARSHGIDPQVVEAVMYVESGFAPNARSNKGALGLMQLMPQTAQQYGVGSPASLFDPATNIECGTRYLAELSVTFAGRLDLMLAAYNAGPGAVMRHGWRVPPFAETQGYVERVMQRLRRSL